MGGGGFRGGSPPEGTVPPRPGPITNLTTLTKLRSGLPNARQQPDKWSRFISRCRTLPPRAARNPRPQRAFKSSTVFMRCLRRSISRRRRAPRIVDPVEERGLVRRRLPRRPPFRHFLPSCHPPRSGSSDKNHACLLVAHGVGRASTAFTASGERQRVRGRAKGASPTPPPRPEVRSDGRRR